MQTVSATYAKQNFAAILDLSQREPVMIRRHARDIAVVMSAEEYKRIRQTRVQGRVRAGLSPTEYLERE
jgi:prevent-host-death family protein